MTLNDHMMSALSAYTGTFNERLYQWGVANGGTSGNTLNEVVLEALQSQGGTGNNLNDLWMSALGNAGYIGTLNERLLQFWLAGGTFGSVLFFTDFTNNMNVGQNLALFQPSSPSPGYTEIWEKLATERQCEKFGGPGSRLICAQPPGNEESWNIINTTTAINATAKTIECSIRLFANGDVMKILTRILPGILWGSSDAVYLEARATAQDVELQFFNLQGGTPFTEGPTITLVNARDEIFTVTITDDGSDMTCSNTWDTQTLGSDNNSQIVTATYVGFSLDDTALLYSYQVST